MRLDGVMIWVQDVPATTAFYEKAFGLSVQMMDESKQFAMMSTGETTLQFADERAAVGTGVSVPRTASRSRRRLLSWRSWRMTSQPRTRGRWPPGQSRRCRWWRSRGDRRWVTSATSTAAWSSSRVRRPGRSILFDEGPGEQLRLSHEPAVRVS